MAANTFLEAVNAVRPKTGTPPAVDDAGLVIENERRRMIVYALVEADEEPLTIGGLAETIAASECEKLPQQLHSDERKRVYVAIYQEHLPKLDAMGVIDYDQDRGTVDPGPSLEPMHRILEVVEATQQDPEPGRIATMLSPIVPSWQPSQSPLTTEEIGVLVENERRRLVIDSIGQVTDGISVKDLSENVASAEYETAPAQLSKVERKRVWISCHQTHLPRLESMDIVDYDPESDEKVARRGPAFDHAQRAIRAVRDECDGGKRGDGA